MSISCFVMASRMASLISKRLILGLDSYSAQDKEEEPDKHYDEADPTGINVILRSTVGITSLEQRKHCKQILEQL